MKYRTGIELSNEDMLRGIRSSDYEVFSLMYLNFFKGLALVSVKYVQDVYVAEEIVQDVFIKIWEQPSGLDGVIHLKSYLYRAVVNNSLNHINRQKNLQVHHERLARESEHIDIQRTYEEQELKVLIYQEIDRLPSQCRKVFKMSRFEGLKYREIAVMLNISERTVENHVANALKVLRARFVENEEFSSEYTRYSKTLISALLLATCGAEILSH